MITRLTAGLLAPPLCWSCRAPAARGSPLCRGCRRALRFLPRAPVKLCGLAVWAPVAYEGPAGELVKGLKFHGATAVAAQMAALIVAGAPEAMLGGTLVPVPLHPGRRRARGFNQAEAIAAAIGARTGRPLADCLARSGPDRRQVGRGRAARLAGPAGSVCATASAPAEAVLVDDVVTTGGTLSACAAALRAAGARQVRAVAFTRTAGR
ncbi:MAG TPA: phosphoribosyltransferase family protein [Methylomirabilota bacterium]|jgi:predicted amidophosphoribosyltransferase|nr:phosphoribosyltransferase family protein [Methylomirabilota bacterium]